MQKECKLVNVPKDRNLIIWRYLDFTKFVSVLDRSSLFFTRADKLGDPFEGALPKWPVGYSDTEIAEKNLPSDIFKSINDYRRFLPKCTILNCWHVNELESAAMWKLYLKSDEGIAIQSTLGRLTSCFLEDSFDILVGLVEYTFIQDSWKKIPDKEDISPFFYKRTYFEHEKELRAVIQDFYHNKNGSINFKKSKFDDGAYIKVDLDILINKVYVAPTSPKWILKLVKSTLMKYDLNKPVIQSGLGDIPSFEHGGIQ